MKILIIDDETDLCLILNSYYTRRGHQVFFSHTFGDGMKQMETLHPDVLFLDNNLPDDTGWSHAAEIAVKFPRTFIYLMSAFHPKLPPMPSNAKFRVLEKPISLENLEYPKPESGVTGAPLPPVSGMNIQP